MPRVSLILNVLHVKRLATFERLLHLYDIYAIIFFHIGMQMVNSY